MERKHSFGSPARSSTIPCSSTTTASSRANTISATRAAAMPPQATAAAASAAPKKKLASSSIFSLKCGCKDAKSVSISNSRSDGGSDRAAADPVATVASLSGRHHPLTMLSSRPETSSADTITFTTATTSTSHDDDDEEEEEVESPSISGLLRQLSELERSVAAWDLRRSSSSRWASAGGAGGTDEDGKELEKPRRRSTHVASYDKAGGKAASFDGKVSQQRGQRHHGPGRHRRSHSEGAGGRALGKVGESVAVVKQTEDPLGDFRRSMLQMIVEKEILSGEELHELLCRFLALNSPSHHALIIRAFSEIWRDVFSGCGGHRDAAAADPVVPTPIHRHRLPAYGRKRHYY